MNGKMQVNRQVKQKENGNKRKAEALKGITYTVTPKVLAGE